MLMTIVGCRSLHQCSYTLCPYHKVKHFNHVIHTGETKSDKTYDYTLLWNIDRLHFKYPYKSYDYLDSLAKIKPARCKRSEFLKVEQACRSGKSIYYKHYDHYHKTTTSGLKTVQL